MTSPVKGAGERPRVRLPLATRESDAPSRMLRREFVQWLAASSALAAGAGCNPPRELIVPYTRPPPELEPGIPLEFATSLTLDGYATGLLVKSREGRPTKVEGNPEHPASLGASSAIDQASVLQLYDPDRASTPFAHGVPAAYRNVLAQLRDPPPARLRVLLEPQSSPSLGAQLASIAEHFSGAVFSFYSPAAPESAAIGHSWLWGEPLVAQYDFARTRSVFALDADFLGSMPFSLRWSRDFADGRRLDTPQGHMNRLYVAEAALSTTGTMADHRLPLRPSEVAGAAAVLLQELAKLGRVHGLPESILAAFGHRLSSDEARRFVQAAARDLASGEGDSAVIAGPLQPPEVHALAQLCNQALGNAGRTVRYTAPILLAAGLPTQPLAALAEEMRAGAVDMLLIIEGNPVYTAPASADFAAALRRVPRSLHLSPYVNETSRACRFFVPSAHYLEAWGDARAYDGTLSFVQPLIAPMHGGRTALELLADLQAPEPTSGYELLRAYQQRALGDAAFAARWTADVQRGFVAGSALPEVKPAARLDDLARALQPIAGRLALSGFELRLAPSPALYDGRFANNAWLQELPDPTTKLTWDNAALISPATAARLGLESEHVVDLAAYGRVVRAPVLVQPGHADDCATLYLGYGRAGSERVAASVGVNAYPLRVDAADYAISVAVSHRGGRHPLALTQRHFTLAERPIAFVETLAGYRAHPDFAQPEHAEQATLLPPRRWEGLQWAMTIDTTVCTGCSACVIACQAENNVPVVGKEGVLHSREMHWLRIDLYFTGRAERPRVLHQPMLCQHCEKAPCEYPCPVNATVHSPDGLNEMVYNRCVGTRFCSNNCPYKVRRFNWFDYQDFESTQLQRNPDVTVRARGVMEKCTYCVQRIRGAEIAARVAGRSMRGDEVTTACQQACPTRAIAFGSLSEPDLPVVRWRKQPRAYAVLRELGTRPRTHYLAKITNPNPELG